MAYAVGNLMLNVGKFGIRQFQVTDIREKYSFDNYVKQRVISTVIMILLSVIYIGYNTVFNGYSFTKSAVVFIICVLKAVEAFEDVYHGRMQQKGRLDVAGRILGARLFIFILGFVVCYVLTRNLLLTALINVIITIIISIFLNSTAQNGLGYLKSETKGKGIVALSFECFPLCACLCMNMYIANSPKYIIDTAVSDEVQTCFNIAFMPVFVIALLANFIFQPALKGLGEVWDRKEYSKFNKSIYKLFLVVVLACAVITAVGSYIGDDILGFIYKVDLSDYVGLLAIFMIAGGVIALQNLFVLAITVVRYQKYMIYGYIATSLIIVAFGGMMLKNNGILVLSWFFLGAMVLLLLYCMALLALAIRNNKLKNK